MPALNSLIARQSIQTTIPHFEGSNDLLTQIFTILNNQQCVPNLSYAPNPRMDENSRQFRESSTHNSSAQSNSEVTILYFIYVYIYKNHLQIMYKVITKIFLLESYETISKRY